MMGYKPAFLRVKEEFKGLDIKTITATEISNYISRFSRTRALKTVSNEILIIRMIFDFAGSQDIIQANPVLFVKVPKGLSKTPREMPNDAEIIKKSLNKTMGLYFYTVLYSGCRKGEALALQWKDIDFKNSLIHVRKSVYFVGSKPKIKLPKTRSGIRDVILLDRLSNVLHPLKGEPDDFLFSDGEGDLLTGGAYDRRVEKFCNESGIVVTAHRLRHAFATMLYEAGLDEKLIQYFLGHAQITTTMDVYAELRKKRMLKSIKQYKSIDIDTEQTQEEDN